MMEHPGPYIPSAQNRIGSRIEWLAAVALFEAASAAAEYRPRITLGPWTWPAPSREWMQARKDYERLRNAEARDRLEQMAGMQASALSGRGIANAAAGVYGGPWHVEQGSDAWQQLFGPRPYWP